jgi:hypothetical protein
MRANSADIAPAWTRANAVHTGTYALLVHEYTLRIIDVWTRQATVSEPMDQATGAHVEHRGLDVSHLFAPIAAQSL